MEFCHKSNGHCQVLQEEGQLFLVEMFRPNMKPQQYHLLQEEQQAEAAHQ